LTEGKPVLGEVIALGDMTPVQILALAGALERSSEHPLARAVLAAASEAGVEMPAVQQFKAVAGGGVLGEVAHRSVVLGSPAWLAEQGIALDGASQGKADELRARGATVVALACDGLPVALLSVVDRIRPHAAEALQALRVDGMHLVMLSGDHASTAQAVARDLGIDEVHAQISPVGKSEVIEQLRKAGRCVAMAGDGINDAPALAAADLGIAMGTGTDIAMHSAQVTLIKADLAAIGAARTISRATVRNIRQNLFFAFVYNAFGVPLAAGLLYPFWGVTLSPMFAALAMSLSSVSVVINALRLSD
jgi:Cu+-exporting ATPase